MWPDPPKRGGGTGGPGALSVGGSGSAFSSAMHAPAAVAPVTLLGGLCEQTDKGCETSRTHTHTARTYSCIHALRASVQPQHARSLARRPPTAHRSIGMRAGPSARGGGAPQARAPAEGEPGTRRRAPPGTTPDSTRPCRRGRPAS